MKIGVHGRGLRFWWPGYNPIYWVMRQCCVTFVVAHVLWVILDVEFDGNIHFYVWLQFEVKVRSRSGQIGLNIQTQNFHYEACLSCPVLSQDSKNDLCFDVRRLEAQKNVFQKHQKFCHGLTPTPLHSGQILFHCEMCWWYVIEWHQNHWHSFISFSSI